MSSSLRRYDRSAAVETARLAAEALGGEAAVRLVFFFGSAAAEDGEGPVRDVDLAVLIEPPPGTEEWQRLRRVASQAGAVPVDLIPLHRAPVALAREIADTGVCLFAESPEAEVDFVSRARARFWDFQPFLEQQW